MLLDKHKYLVFTMILLLFQTLVGCSETESNQTKSKEKDNNIEKKTRDKNSNIEIVKLDGKVIISATVSNVF